MVENVMEVTAPPAQSASFEGEVFVMPCSISQKRFWMLEQMSPGNTALNIPIALKLSGPLDVQILEQALNAIVSRHEILRTHFALIDEEPRQVISSHVAFKLHRIDWGNLPPEQHAARIRQAMDAEAQQPLDLRHAPLLRATLLRLAPQESVLMFTAHHIISDGWSSGVLVRELGLFYDALRQDRPADLPPLAIQFADYALWQEEWLKTPEFQKQLDYWREAFGEGDLPVLDFPTDFQRQAGQGTEAILEGLLLPQALSEALKRFCLEEGVTFFMLFFNAYFILLHRYTGQARLMIGTTAANRNKPELEALIGLFANILILHSEVPGDMPFREFLVRQRDQSLASFANHEAPFEKVLEELQQRKTLPTPLLQTHFLFQKAFMQPVACGDLTIRPLHSISPGSTFELTFGIVERQEGIRLQMEYRTSLFQPETIRHLLQHFQALLESIVAHPETPLDALPLFAGDEREKLESALYPQPATSASTFDPSALLQDLARQLDTHFQKDTTPFAPPADLPPGAFLIALDFQLRLLPIGIPGDVYFGHPSLNSEDVLGPSDAAVPVPLFKTGFLGRNNEDARVELWGRPEDFVRVQGFRFNVRVIETRLRLHPDVAEAAVAIHPQASDRNKLVGYIVPKSGAMLSSDDLRAFLRGKISDFILPSAILSVSCLPRDAHGDLLVDQLPLPMPSARQAATDHVPMRAILHQQLLEIWEGLLKTSGLTIDDNFFECGGNSFLALRMMLQVEKLCGRPLPLSLLITGATVANLASYIVETANGSEIDTPLIPLQTRGTKPPLFFLHGDWAGGGFYCNRLSAQLGNDQPFYVLPPYHMREEKLLTIQEMAAWHCAAVRKQSPHGPYFLGGYCIGAAVAMEMARQFIAEGETVAHLFLIDPPVWAGPWFRRLWPLADKIGDAQKWTVEKKIDFFDRYLVSLIRWGKRPLAAKLASLGHRLGLKIASASSADDLASDDAELVDSFAYTVYFLAYRLYSLQPLPVPATLYFPESTPAARLAGLSRSSRMDPAKYTIEMLPGNHTTCVTKHTAALAEKIKERLDSLG
jgi:pimeloyl-ACP methyl ester carboxylesterase